MTGAAELHTTATLTPSKLDLLGKWLPTQEWFVGDASDLAQAARFRFVDPAGEVGLDSMVVTSGEYTYYVPVTWRGQPLDGATLIGTLEHSELGTRYCYDAATDPVFVAEATRVIVEGDKQADLVDAEGNHLPQSMSALGSGSGEPTGELALVRRLDRGAEDSVEHGGVLEVSWADADGPRTDVVATLS